MNRVRLSAFLVVVGLSAPAGAQDLPAARLFPGSINVSSGMLSPSESGNVMSSTTVDQGVSVWRSGSLFVLGYASVTERNDIDGHPWNNNTPIAVGARVAKSWTSGILQVNVGLGVIANASTGPAAGPVAYASYWAGWRHPRAHPNRFILAFPGHVWASSGIVTALEPGNWITNASAEEGVTTWRYRQFDVVSFGALTAARDSKGNAWNNKTVADAGAKVQRFVPGGVIEAGAGARLESYQTTHVTQSGPVVFVNFWLGWDPRRTHK